MGEPKRAFEKAADTSIWRPERQAVTLSTAVLGDARGSTSCHLQPAYVKGSCLWKVWAKRTLAVEEPRGEPESIRWADTYEPPIEALRVAFVEVDHRLHAVDGRAVREGAARPWIPLRSV